MILATGFEVSSRAGNFSGTSRSARFRSSELNQKWLSWSVINSPISTGLDSSSRGGRVSGEITSPRLVNTVRNQGKLRRSPRSNPTLTGRDVSSRSGKLSGANVSRKLMNRDFHKGRVRDAGGRRSIGISGKAEASGSGNHSSAALERYDIRSTMLDGAASFVTHVYSALQGVK